MSTKRYRARMRPPCGCTMQVTRPRLPGDVWCRVSGPLYRVTLSQMDWITKAKYRLVCGLHRSRMQRAGQITAAERIT